MKRRSEWIKEGEGQFIWEELVGGSVLEGGGGTIKKIVVWRGRGERNSRGREEIYMRRKGREGVVVGWRGKCKWDEMLKLKKEWWE